MEIVLLLGLGIWVLIIQIRLASAESQLRRFSALHHSRPQPIADPGPPVARPIQRTAPPEPAPVQPVASPPQPSLAPTPGPLAEAAFTDIIAAQPAAAPIGEITSAKPSSTPTRPPLSIWLSENGLAWAGGGALALGGALLVAYAAQQGMFTPIFRVLIAGEWIRRRTTTPSGRHGPAAAIVSGAGASTLYAAVWASYALYHFLPLPLAAGLLGVICLGLLAVAVLHGEALALLAIGGAMIAPIICHLPNWNGVALDGYLVAIAATGLGMVGLRGWTRVGLLTLGAVDLWALGRMESGDIQGAAGLLVAALAMALLAERHGGGRTQPEERERLHGLLAPIACVAASFLWLMLATFLGTREAIALALVGGAVSLLCAAAVRIGLISQRVLLAPAFVLIAVALERSVAAGTGPTDQQNLWLLAPVMLFAIATLALRLADETRGEAAVIGAAASALALTLLRAKILANLPFDDALIFLLAAASFGCGAALIAARSKDPAADWATAAWVGAAAEAAGLAIHAALPGRPEPFAYGLLGLALAIAARRLPWRGLAEAASLACLVSLIALLGPKVADAALSGALPWTSAALVGAAAVAAQSGVWWVLRGKPGASIGADSASTTALVSALLTAFLVLRVFATPHGTVAGSLDVFTEAALRTLLLLMVGLISSVRSGPGLVSRVRGPVFLAMGALHGLLLGVIVLNPWGGWGPADAGPPIVDALALAYLGPALLLGAAARIDLRRPDQPAWMTATRAASGFCAFAFGAVWAVMEIRRLFHGPVLSAGAYSYSEICAYALACVVFAWLVTLVAVRIVPQARPMVGAAVLNTVRWICLAISTGLVCLVASPWWGPLAGPFTGPVLFFALFTLTGMGTGLLAGRDDLQAERTFCEVAKVATALEVFAGLTLAIRFGFHGPAMRTHLLEASLETWAYSAVWAVYGLVVVVAGARRDDRMLRWLGLGILVITTLKVFLFDMATLSGVIRAASFLALGALLLVGALGARRLGGRPER
jgi:hypothetical protein